MQVIQQVRTWLRGGRPPLPAIGPTTGRGHPAADGGPSGVLGSAMAGPPRPRLAPVAEHVAALVAALEGDRAGSDCRAFRERGVAARWRVLMTYFAVCEDLVLVPRHELELLEALGQHCRRARLMALPSFKATKPARQTCYVLTEPAAAAGKKPQGKKKKGSRQRAAGSRAYDLASGGNGGGGRIGKMWRPPAKVPAS